LPITAPEKLWEYPQKLPETKVRELRFAANSTGLFLFGSLER